MRSLVVRSALIVSVFLAGCATTTPNYDPQARESVGRIVAKGVAGARTQPAADSYNPAPAFVAAIGLVGAQLLGDALEKKTSVPVHVYRIQTEDGREVSVLSDYSLSEVGECVKLLESSQPTYPRFVSHSGCR